MRIESITLRELGMRLRFPFETSFGVTQMRRILLVEMIADGVTGWGEVTTAEAPFYNYETTDTAWHIISDFITPLLIGKEVRTATDIPSLVSKIRGHQMAKAGVENALWDIEAQQKNISLVELLGGTKNEIACGVSLGIRESPEALVNKVAEELGNGYPEPKNVGVMPAYGVFARHIRGLELANIHVSFDKPDYRPAISCIDVDGLEIDNFKAQLSEGVPAAKFDGVKGLVIRNSPLLDGVKAQ